ncbi:MAG: tripartite tricarboxylate transporter permease [Vallitalea sp.]|jgi:putative tricarboxylic transport membrane protein|nr:tripartite tricarboxylate transporter permease [Vallitalea sp.]
MLQNFVEGLGYILSVQSIIFMNIGLFIGIVFGVIPGLSANVGIVLLLPFTFALSPVNAILMLLGIYCGGTYGGSISAILIGTPGTNAAAATLLDGYPLAQQGKAKKALMMALVASTIGGIISALILLFASPSISKFTLNFGPPEYFALGIFGLSVIGSVSGKNLFKGLMAGCFGVLISMVGLDTMSGVTRFTFDNVRLMTGLGLLPVLLGLFAVEVVLTRVYQLLNTKEKDNVIEFEGDDTLSFAEVKKCMPSILKSTVIGTIIGAIPGIGTGVASFISYNEAKRNSKEPEKFGKGAIEGVAAPEAGNNAVTGASLIPLLTLGIPGSAVAATLLGALMMHGLIPGPNLFRSQGPIVYAIMIGFVIINIFMYIQGKFLSKVFAKVTEVPQPILLTILIVTCFSGAFSLKNTVFYIYILIAFGIISYFLRKIGIPAVPIVLGFILGPIVEFNLRRALVMSEGSYLIFVTRPICLAFLVLTVIFIISLRKQVKTN